MRAFALLAVLGFLLPACSTAAADDTGRSFTREETGVCGDWPPPLDPSACYVHAQATVIVTDCDADSCNFTLSQTGHAHMAIPGLMHIGVIYDRTDYADVNGTQDQAYSCVEVAQLESIAESMDPNGFHCQEACRNSYDLATDVGCSAVTRDRAHVPPGFCSAILDGAQFDYELVEGAQAYPTFEICRDASGAVTVF